MAVDRITEIESVDKITEVEKFNPYHDQLGRFSDGSGSGAAHFTVQTKNPAHQHWADMAIARAQGKIPPTKAKPSKTTIAANKQNTTDPSKSNWVNTEKQSGHITGPINIITTTESNCRVSQEKAIELNRAIQRFSGFEYSDIRKASIGENNDKGYQKTANDIEEFIQRSPKWDGGAVHRGIDVDKSIADKIIKQAKNGEKLDMRGMSSWSSDKSVAEDPTFGNVKGKNDRVSVIFHTNGQTSKYGTSIRHISDIKSEDEVVHSKNARYRATNVEKTTNKNGRTIYNVYVDEI